MREIVSVFMEGFTKGLLRNINTVYSDESLSESYNMVPDATGLTARTDILDHFTGFTSNWPFPHLISTRKYLLLCTSNALYKIQQDTYDPYLISDDIDWGGIPHVADFYDTVILSSPNGQYTYFDGQLIDNVAGASFSTCCEFRGQLIIGNGSMPTGPEHVASTGDLATDIKYTTKVMDRHDPLLVGWSKIGAIDWEYTLGNEVGFTSMPWTGCVHKILTLGNKVVIYGDNGVVHMSPESSPVSTFGINHWGRVGILNRNCVAGDDVGHVFLGSDYKLYSTVPERALSSEGQTPALLGYYEYMKELVNPIVSFDLLNRHWWIGDADKCYILTAQGLGESSVTPSGMGTYLGEVFAPLTIHGTEEAVVKTSSLSFNSRGFKTLATVEVDISSSKPVTGHTFWKSDYSQDFRPSRDIRLDPRGGLFPMVAGVEFRQQFKTSDFRNFLISKIWFRIKHTDKTFARGAINVNKNEQ